MAGNPSFFDSATARVDLPALDGPRTTMRSPRECTGSMRHQAGLDSTSHGKATDGVKVEASASAQPVQRWCLVAGQGWCRTLGLVRLCSSGKRSLKYQVKNLPLPAARYIFPREA